MTEHSPECLAGSPAADPSAWGILRGALDPTGFPARWRCGTAWTPLLGWLHIVSDVLIWASYMTIPALLAVYILRKRDVPFTMAGWLFVAFIFACGTGHLVEAGMFWWPVYRLSGLVKFGTAAVSVATAIVLVPILPKALMLPGLARVNAELANEIRERQRAEERLERALAFEKMHLQRERSLLHELDHRVRNNLAGLLGLIGIYERSAKTVPDATAALRGKVRAMMHVHELMSPNPGSPIDLASLVRRLADQAVVSDRRAAVEVGGPDVLLVTKQAGAMAMIVQELLTNSAKHGALRAPGGSIRVNWELRPDNDGALMEFTWLDRFERSGREAPAEGVGLRLIRGFVSTEFRGACEFMLIDGGFLCVLLARPDASDVAPIREASRRLGDSPSAFVSAASPLGN